MDGMEKSGNLTERQEKSLIDSNMEEESNPGNPVNLELPPLVIPEGISADELSKVFMNIILRRALCENDPLSKWVLLGAAEVLQGRTPKLTTTMLSQLVNGSQQFREQGVPSQSSRSVGTQVDMMETKKFEDRAAQIELWKKIEQK